MAFAEQVDGLVVAHLALAQAVARRFYRRDPARDEDLLQVAYLGLTKAAQRFDPDRGTSFAAFATPTISGEIKRHLRDHGWFVRPPRPVQQLRSEAAAASTRLSQSLHRPPTIAELAADLGATEDDVRDALAAEAHLVPVSLDGPAGGDAGTLADVLPDDGARLEHAEQAVVLWSVLRTLPPRERRVLHLRFFAERTQHEIATELGLTQVQVSRILSATLRLLRDHIVHGVPRRTGTA